MGQGTNDDDDDCDDDKMTITKQLLMAMKVPSVVQLAREARAEGKCVVIGLQTTGEARMAEALKEAGEEGLEEARGGRAEAALGRDRAHLPPARASVGGG